MGSETKRVVVRPADDVTDLDEWLARVEQALSIERIGTWQAEGTTLIADLAPDDAVVVLTCIRESLGEAAVAEVDAGVDIDVAASVSVVRIASVG